MATEPNVIMGTTSTVRTLADGGMKITIDIAPGDMKRAFALFGDAGTAIGMVPLTVEAAKQQAQKDMVAAAEQASEAGPYGKHFELLFKRGWFFNPRVQKVFAPHNAVDEIKGQFYTLFKVDSLARINPDDFKVAVQNLGLTDTLPRGFGE